LKEKADMDILSDKFKDIESIPLPFKCMTELQDKMADNERGDTLNQIAVPGSRTEARTQDQKNNAALNAVNLSRATHNNPCCI
jgi:hypothetical protein